ncbi:MAG TPA: hypothetical protein VFL92_03135 [Sphingomonas sp.]|nr:hypothetical protein [Sphingomonas sp.]
MSKLRELHAELASCMAELEELTARPQPDRDAIASARWRLSRTSGRRTRLLEEEIYPALSGRDDPGLRKLREANAAVSALSTSHIATWSIERVMADWPGYCAASGRVRQAMRDRIALEREALYPLLEASPPPSGTGERD